VRFEFVSHKALHLGGRALSQSPYVTSAISRRCLRPLIKPQAG
jgi:hypothetical protein